MKWNQTIRRIVFERLFEKYGPLREWHKTGNPTGVTGEYKKFLTDTAEGLSKITGLKCTVGALQNQIDWGIQPRQSVIKSQSYVRNFILNRAAALESGLITSSELPSYALFEVKEGDIS